jgi:squalene-associated FAD-dependent desaturase
MKKVIVVGGGLAGLSASVYLSENNFEVTLLEASPKLGGRTYSIYNPSQKNYYDNGQHILMGCYEETLAFLEKIEMRSKLYEQESLNITFVEKGGKISYLNASKKFYPLNLLFAILNYKALTFKERLKVIDFFIDLICCESCDLQNTTVEKWLACKKQSPNSIKALWEILVAGALNTKSKNASAEIFREVITRIFLTGNKSSTILIPQTDLSNLFINSAVKFIQKRKGRISTSEKVEQIDFEKNSAIKIKTNKKNYKNFDFVVCAVPSSTVKKINCNINLQQYLPKFEYSPILNMHFWLKENPFKQRFYGLIDSKIHWIFNHSSHITCTTSSANEIISLNNGEIKRLFCSEIELYFPIFNSKMIVDFKIIKEKAATFIPDVDSTIDRKKFLNNFDNLFFAGDWINTGLPSTIESAVLSGRLAYENAVSKL